MGKGRGQMLRTMHDCVLITRHSSQDVVLVVFWSFSMGTRAATQR